MYHIIEIAEAWSLCLIPSHTLVALFSDCTSFFVVCTHTHTHAHAQRASYWYRHTHSHRNEDKPLLSWQNKIISSERKCLFMPKRFWHACHNTGLAYHFAFSAVSCTPRHHNGSPWIGCMALAFGACCPAWHFRALLRIEMWDMSQ